MRLKGYSDPASGFTALPASCPPILVPCWGAPSPALLPSSQQSLLPCLVTLHATHPGDSITLLPPSGSVEQIRPSCRPLPLAVRCLSVPQTLAAAVLLCTATRCEKEHQADRGGQYRLSTCLDKYLHATDPSLTPDSAFPPRFVWCSSTVTREACMRPSSRAHSCRVSNNATELRA